MASRGDYRRRLYGRLADDLDKLTLTQVAESLGESVDRLTTTEKERLRGVLEDVKTTIRSRSVRHPKGGSVGSDDESDDNGTASGETVVVETPVAVPVPG